MRNWYLTDGGHFENMGVYELVRRRVPLIILCDAEQDDDFTFPGLANLVRKARIDFHTEITFFDANELDQHVDAGVRPLFGTLEQLRKAIEGPATSAAAAPGAPSDHPAHAALAWIEYPAVGATPASRGLLLYIKPTLTGDEPTDVLEYARTHGTFPHETTANQFFDEAQWESYRRLGEHIGRRLFGTAAAAGGWAPQEMHAIP